MTSIWVSKLIITVVNICFELWVTLNNKVLGSSPEEQRDIQHIRTIQVITLEYTKGFMEVQTIFSMLFYSL